MENTIVKCITESSTDWSSIIMAIASVLNLFLIVWIFSKDKKNEKKLVLREYNISWYRLINIEERVNNINSYVSNTILDMCALNNDPERDLEKRKKISTEIILKFNNEIETEKNIISSILKPLDAIENSRLLNMLNNLYELQNLEIQNSILQCLKINPENINEKKDEIITEYYEIGKNIIKS